MIQKPMDVLQQFPIRKSKKQKAAFRQAATEYAQQLGYAVTEEKGSLGSRNLIIGNPESAAYLVTAHYDTPAGLPFPNLITPCNFWPFVGYQLVGTILIFLGATVISLMGAVAVGNADAFFVFWYLALWGILILMMIGPANKNNANDNTSGVVTVLTTAKNLPEELRERVCFVLFDLEEPGLIGSSSYRSKHKKQNKKQLVLNCDCVGEGDHLVMFPTRMIKTHDEMVEALRGICGTDGTKRLVLRERGFAYFPSDQCNFPYGVGIAALHDTWAGLCCDKIHTKKDTVLDENNVNYLCRALIQLIGGQPNKKGN